MRNWAMLNYNPPAGPVMKSQRSVRRRSKSKPSSGARWTGCGMRRMRASTAAHRMPGYICGADRPSGVNGGIAPRVTSKADELVPARAAATHDTGSPAAAFVSAVELSLVGVSRIILMLTDKDRLSDGTVQVG